MRSERGLRVGLKGKWKREVFHLVKVIFELKKIFTIICLIFVEIPFWARKI